MKLTVLHDLLSFDTELLLPVTLLFSATEEAIYQAIFHQIQSSFPDVESANHLSPKRNYNGGLHGHKLACAVSQAIHAFQLSLKYSGLSRPNQHHK